MHAVLAKRLQALDQRLAALVEVLVDGFEAFFGHRFDADQRALDVRALHGLQELGIFRRFHRDLREEHRVLGEPRELSHQREALRTDRLQLMKV